MTDGNKNGTSKEKPVDVRAILAKRAARAPEDDRNMREHRARSAILSKLQEAERNATLPAIRRAKAAVAAGNAPDPEDLKIALESINDSDMDKGLSRTVIPR